jgi:hypothetical protein
MAIPSEAEFDSPGRTAAIVAKIIETAHDLIAESLTLWRIMRVHR